jgi:hypothetical protein
MITVVMLNYARPRNALFNLHAYSSYSIVKDIFCFNNGAPLTEAGRLPRKCVLVQASKNLGLYPRFATASLAATEAVFHTDDDLILPERTLAALYSSWAQAKGSCHGLFGRIAYPTYKLGNVFGPVEVLLTRALMCSRRVNNLALSSTDFFSDLRGKPHGNGEDIILSFAGMAASKHLNLAYRLPARDHGGKEHFAIHRSWPGHLEHRRRIVSRCRKVFFGQAA